MGKPATIVSNGLLSGTGVGDLVGVGEFGLTEFGVVPSDINIEFAFSDIDDCGHIYTFTLSNV